MLRFVLEGEGVATLLLYTVYSTSTYIAECGHYGQYVGKLYMPNCLLHKLVASYSVNLSLVVKITQAI